MLGIESVRSQVDVTCITKNIKIKICSNSTNITSQDNTFIYYSQLNKEKISEQMQEKRKRKSFFKSLDEYNKLKSNN